jgi:hypothetical protein
MTGLRQAALTAGNENESGYPVGSLVTAITSAEMVIAGLDPVIHPLRKDLLAEMMDARIKSGMTRVRVERARRAGM